MRKYCVLTILVFFFLSNIQIKAQFASQFIILVADSIGYGFYQDENVSYQDHLVGDVVEANRYISSANILAEMRIFSHGIRPVTRIGERAFQNCLNLKHLNIPAPLITIEMHAFLNCLRLDTIRLPETRTLKTIGANAFQDCQALTYINIPIGVKTFGRAAFFNCHSLPRIDIPYTVEEIGDYAFARCRSLKSAVISTNVYKLGDGAFQCCNGLESVELASKRGFSILPETFDSCTSLKRVIMTYDKIYRIDSCAFRGCKNLTQITLPASLIHAIGPSAFEGCAALDTVTALVEQPLAFGADAFKGISPTCVLMVPYGRRAAYIAAGWTEEVFKGGVKEIIPAGISQVKANTNAKEAGCYDLQGRKIQEPQKGLNIIRYNDGTTRKVMK